MHEQFDKRLSEKIRDVFDAYEDDTADAGWKELRKRFPAREKKRRALYWWSAAAMLGVVLGIAGYVHQLPVAGGDTQVQRISRKGEDTALPVRPGNSDAAVPASTDHNGSPGPVRGREASGQLARAAVESVAAAEPGATADAADAPVQLTENGEFPVPELSVTTVSGLKPNVVAELSSFPAAGVTGGTDRQAAFPAGGADPAREPEAVVAAVEPRNEESRSAPEQKQKRPVTFGIVASQFLNYAQGSRSNLNTSAGFSSEFPLNKHFRLTTGLSIARNRLQYDAVPERTARALLASAEPAYLSAPSMGAILPAPSAGPDYSLSALRATLLGLDIPLNLKYSVALRKNVFVLSSGVSSNYFISESYRYNYQYNLVNVASAPVEAAETDRGSFSSFSFANMLNVSAGFGYSVGKQNKLFVEPFIKYPLNDVGSRNLRFGAAGLNLRIQFNQPKNIP
jgi:hypothetical protein